MIEKIYLDETKNLLDFIKRSPSCYHVIANIRQDLLKCGYAELSESKKWNIKKGGKYFTVRNDSSVIAFKLPKKDFDSFMICASHSDSPSFKLKPNFEAAVAGLYTKLNCERYGGMIYSSWLDRPLSIAGRLLIETKKGLDTKLVNIDRDLCLIPNLAIHMNRDINNGYTYNLQNDMLPLVGSINTKNMLNAELATVANVDADDILDYDLFLYDRTNSSIWGSDNEYFSATKIDDLQCVYSSTKAFVEADNKNTLNILAIFDNEEVGSGTKQGALSTFLTDTLGRVCDSLGISASEFAQNTAASYMLSADNGHAVHPNHPDKADITSRPTLNNGILIKYNANQQYTTDAVSGAIFKKLLKNADIPYQEYANRSDIPGGSTLGNLSNRHLSLNTIDIGAPQLSMHSAYETGGVKDTKYLTDAVKCFYEAKLTADENGSYKINA